MIEQNEEAIRYRIARALETLDDANLLADEDRWHACVNRLYYACFYSVSALLLKHNLSSSKHTGVRGLFNRHFVKPEIISRDLARCYNDLFERRHESDYLDFMKYEAQQVRPWMDQAKTFVHVVIGVIGSGISLDNQQ